MKQQRSETTSEEQRSEPGQPDVTQEHMDRRSVLARTSQLSAGALFLPAIASARSPAALSPGLGNCPLVTGIDDNNPTVGQTVTISGANFPSLPSGLCLPGIAPTSVNAAGTQVVGTVLNVPGTFQLEAANFTSSTGLGAGGTVALQAPPGSGATWGPDGMGAVGTVDPADVTQTNITVNVSSGAGTTEQLPVFIDGSGRICIDFAGTDWTGDERVEIELHFDISPPPTAGDAHCDFYATSYDVGGPGDAADCAIEAAFIAVLNSSHECPNLSVLPPAAGETAVYLLAPPGHTFVNLHPLTHVAVMT